MNKERQLRRSNTIRIFRVNRLIQIASALNKKVRKILELGPAKVTTSSTAKSISENTASPILRFQDSINGKI
jgi:hypothetical protein